MDDVVQFLEDGNVMDPPEDTPSPIYSTMLACWHLEPQDRPTFDDLRCMLESFKGEHTTQAQTNVVLCSRTNVGHIVRNLVIGVPYVVVQPLLL